MSKYIQENLFSEKRIGIDESIQILIDTMNNYGPLHDHWCIAWSGGKDSTCLLTLIVYLLETEQIKKPKTLSVYYADTRQELTPIQISSELIIEKLKSLSIDVKIVCADIENRFLVYILGRGVPPPSNTFRWCTGKIKVEPMLTEINKLFEQHGQSILVLTGVRIGESAVRDDRIKTSCSKDGAECGQGWYQYALNGKSAATLAPILHFRVCLVWDWLKLFAPMKRFGAWPTQILADAYGGDQAEEINARTGCIGCPLTQEDKALDSIVNMPDWSYLLPLKDLKPIYRWLRKPENRLRKSGGQKTVDGRLQKNQNRLGPLTLETRQKALEQILEIQSKINADAVLLGRPTISILNEQEEFTIRKMINENVWPNGWDGTEINGSVIIPQTFADGSVQPILF
jgi:DNA sulfur modification protein DndC